MWARANVASLLPPGTVDKRGTPIMGGLLIVLVLDVTTFLWAQWNTLILLTMLTAVVLCGLGFIDDYAKITQQNSKGVQEFVKLWVQGALAIFAAFYLWRLPSTTLLISQVMVPFYKYPVATGGAGVILGILVTSLTIVGSSNAVNLTDGLDGLAIGCTAIVSFVFLVLTYVAGNAKATAYLQIPHVSGAGELTVFCAAKVIAASLGFFVVQLSAGPGFHGRHRLAGAGRGAGDDRRADSPTVGVGAGGRSALVAEMAQSSSSAAGSNTPARNTARAGACS